VGVDTNPAIIQILHNGKTQIFEPGLKEIVQTALESGRLIVQSEPSPADAFIIAVPTPFKEDKKADMEAVKSAASAIVPHLRKGNLVVLESTSPPRTTTDLVIPILERSGLQAGRDFMVAYSPERVLPGQILIELISNARVIGGINKASAEAGRDLYATFVKGNIILTDATTAEMVKLMENTYRDVNIAIANEFSKLADRFGIDIWEAIDIANLHPRVKILNPGPGVGGHCISVDPWFLVEAAPDITPLILASREVNDSQPHFVVDIVKEAMSGKVENKNIAVLGLSYKPDVDDIRESPSVEVASLLSKAGAKVKAFEPFRPDAEFNNFCTASSLEEVLKDADALLLLVAHTQFKNIDPLSLASSTPARIAIDAVNGWKSSEWNSAGFKLVKLGVKK
jgi:UDP-N-acetyl-D-mannosaminuronic acid dehydrogenase